MQTLENTTKVFEERLVSLLKEELVGDTLLFQTAKHAACLGGKRLRPRMLLAIAGREGLDAACAIECIHNYSLVHDDLPCMDNDIERRGRPTVHVAFGEANAVLAGDFLLTYAFEILSNLHLQPDLICQIIRSVTKRIGSQGMLGGQSQDMLSKERSITWETYQQIAIKKTSTLFILSLEVGALIANYDQAEIKVLTEFGHTFGLIYQIADDLEDEDFPSAVAVLGRERACNMLSLLINHAREVLDRLKTPIPFLSDCLDECKHET